jgi:actin-related protein 5
MSELLFEYYSIPSAVYGVDALFSWSKESEMASTRDSLVLRLGQHCAHVLPILSGTVIAEHARRINVGGIHITSFFHRLMQLKNPMLAPSISVSQAEVGITMLFPVHRVSWLCLLGVAVQARPHF